MHPISVILFCNQPNLRGDPLKSWAFDQIGETTYLSIILDRWRKFGNINKIYLLADSTQLADKLITYENETVRVKIMSHESHRPLGLTRARIYNFGTRQEENISSWIYQIMKSENESVIFVDSIVKGHVNFGELNRLRKKIYDQPGHCYTMSGQLGIEGKLLDLTFMENCISNPSYDGLKFDHPDNLNHGHLHNYDNYTTNRSLKSEAAFDWHIDTRQRWQFFSQFYSSITIHEDKDVFIEFLEYLELHGDKLNTMDLLHLELDCVDQLGTIKMTTIDRLISSSLPFGRLTVVLNNLDKHPHGDKIVEQLHNASLHIYASIVGHRAKEFYEKIYTYSDVINFTLFAHTPEFHAQRFPQEDANLIFQNYLTALLISQKSQRMAVGVTYQIPDDMNEACQAILFFRERQSINPFFDSSDTRPGVQQPHIQFLRLIPASGSKYTFRSDISSKTLRINSRGQFANGENCFDKSIEKYLRDYGFDGQGILP
tara:strand:- start:1979 stop:3436 length:1458 start_codon:yes stop_codon:yes gene_type:complete